MIFHPIEDSVEAWLAAEGVRNAADRLQEGKVLQNVVREKTTCRASAQTAGAYRDEPKNLADDLRLKASPGGGEAGYERGPVLALANWDVENGKAEK